MPTHDSTDESKSPPIRVYLYICTSSAVRRHVGLQVRRKRLIKARGDVSRAASVEPRLALKLDGLLLQCVQHRETALYALLLLVHGCMDIDWLLDLKDKL